MTRTSRFITLGAVVLGLVLPVGALGQEQGPSIWQNVKNNDALRCDPNGYVEGWNPPFESTFRKRVVRAGVVVYERDGITNVSYRDVVWVARAEDRLIDLRCEIYPVKDGIEGVPLTIRYRVYPADPDKKQPLLALNRVTFPQGGFGAPTRRKVTIGSTLRTKWRLVSRATGTAFRGSNERLDVQLQYFRSSLDARAWYGSDMCARVRKWANGSSTARRKFVVTSCRPTKVTGAQAVMTWTVEVRFTRADGVKMTDVLVESYGRLWYGTFYVSASRLGRASKAGENLRAILRYHVPLRTRLVTQANLE